jgi:hypothetical protein
VNTTGDLSVYISGKLIARLRDCKLKKNFARWSERSLYDVVSYVFPVERKRKDHTDWLHGNCMNIVHTMNVHFIGFQTEERRSMLCDQTQENISQNNIQYLFS